MSHYEDVDVITGARLHFGLMCGTPESGWQFGGIGLMVDRPGWHIRLAGNAAAGAHPAPSASLRGKVTEILSRLGSKPGQSISPAISPDAVQLLEICPHHAGFGAGTQLALAIGSAVEVRLHRSPRTAIPELSQLLGRSSRSAVGTAGFAQGGLLVDHGLPAGDDPDSGRRVDRLSVPEAWRFLLVRPRQSEGLSGEQEREYFEQRRVMPMELVTTLAALVTQQLVPAVERSDFRVFAESLGQYGQLIGRFYSPAQGDIFSDAQMNGLAAWLSAQGVPGTAQSSWGPGICVPLASASDAASLAARIAGHLNDPRVEITIAAARNCGATIRTRCPEPDRGVRA